MSNKTVLILCITSAALASYATKRFYPDLKVEVVEKVVSKDKIVTVTKEVVRPDGTRETDTTKVEDRVKVEDKKLVVAEVKEANWHITLGSDFSLQGSQQFQLGIERRVLGPLFLGAYGRSDKSLGITLGFEF